MADPSTVCGQVTLLNTLGLHARAAATFVKAFTGLQADVEVRWEGRTVNGRSMLDLMTLGAPQGSVLEIRISGADAEAALATITKIVEKRFHEE